MTKQGIILLASIISTLTLALFNHGSVEKIELTKSTENSVIPKVETLEPSMSTEMFNTKVENVENVNFNLNENMNSVSIFKWIYNCFGWISFISSIYVIISKYWYVFTILISYFSQQILSWLWKKIYKYLFGANDKSKPIVFSEGMNVYKWLNEFESYLESNKITNSNLQARYLMNSLDASSRRLLIAACEIETDGDKIKVEYENVKNQLLQLFLTTRINLRDLRIKFYNRIQAKDESIHRYVQELKEMAKEAYPLTDKKLLDSYIYTQFLYGVRNQRIQQKLIDEYGTTTNLQEVIRVAKLQEQYEEIYLRKKFENDTEVEIKIKKASIDDNSNKDQLNKPSVSFKNNVFSEDKTTVDNNPEHIKEDNKHKNCNNRSRDTSKETRESSVDSRHDFYRKNDRENYNGHKKYRYRDYYNRHNYTRDDQYNPNNHKYKQYGQGYYNSKNCRDRVPTPYKHEKPTDKIQEELKEDIKVIKNNEPVN